MNEKYDSESDNNSYESSTDSSIDSKNNENNSIDPVKFFTVKELCYYKTIDKFFKGCADENISKMIDIIEGKSHISLRVLDWFVTKYSKKKIDCGINKDAEIFDVRISYKSQLKSYKKKYFDPFRRRKKFVYYFGDRNDNKYIDTTLGQLNFFKWAFYNNVLVYVDKNLKNIIKEMNNSNKEEKKKKVQKKLSSNDNISNDDKPQKVNKKKIKITSTTSEPNENIKINAIKTTDNDEVQIVLKFD